MTRALITVVAALLVAQPAMAAEVWSRSNEPGNYTYARDIGTQGLMTYAIGDSGLSGAMFVDGLAGNTDVRHRFTGYWTEPARKNTPSCGVTVTDAQGLTTDYWGRIEVLFVDPSPPSKFILLYGTCFDEPTVQIVATPVLERPR